MPTALTRLTQDQWRAAAAAHAARADTLTAAHRARRAAGEKHAIEDFLYDYYGTKASSLRRWHPGVGVSLDATQGVPPHASWRWYSRTADGAVALDARALLAERGGTVAFVHRLLSATESRAPFTGCFGLHEWAMAYRVTDHRHPLPLRLGQRGTDEVVESHQIRCTHYDAFRFFTPEAVGRNALQPTRDSQVELEQPGCLHASMDCFKWATKLGPAVPGALMLDCFELARDVRLLDMQASPYDLTAYGEPAVPIETAAGKADYARRQRDFAARAASLRRHLVEVCEQVLAA